MEIITKYNYSNCWLSTDEQWVIEMNHLNSNGMEKLFGFKNSSNMQISIFYAFSQPETGIDFIEMNILNVILHTIFEGAFKWKLKTKITVLIKQIYNDVCIQNKWIRELKTVRVKRGMNLDASWESITWTVEESKMEDTIKSLILSFVSHSKSLFDVHNNYLNKYIVLWVYQLWHASLIPATRLIQSHLLRCLDMSKLLTHQTF